MYKTRRINSNLSHRWNSNTTNEGNGCRFDYLQAYVAAQETVHFKLKSDDEWFVATSPAFSKPVSIIPPPPPPQPPNPPRAQLQRRLRGDRAAAPGGELEGRGDVGAESNTLQL